MGFTWFALYKEVKSWVSLGVQGVFKPSKAVNDYVKTLQKIKNFCQPDLHSHHYVSSIIWVEWSREPFLTFVFICVGTHQSWQQRHCRAGSCYLCCWKEYYNFFIPSQISKSMIYLIFGMYYSLIYNFH